MSNTRVSFADDTVLRHSHNQNPNNMSYSNMMEQNDEDPDQADYRLKHKELMQQKARTQKRIESLRREYDFVSKLEATDMAFVLDKKQEQAVLTIQRLFRALKARLHYKNLKDSKGRFDSYANQHYELSSEDKRRIQELKAKYESQKSYTKSSKPDTMWQKISTVRQNAIKDEIKRRRLAKSDAEIEQLQLANIQADFDAKYEEFINNFADFEKSRVNAVDSLRDIETTEQFLFQMTNEELHAIEKRITNNHTTAQTYDKAAEDVLNNQAYDRLNQLPLWSQVLPSDEIKDDERKNVIIEHKERLNRYRKWKDWQAWVERDELDLEGDRVLADVKNFKSEFLFGSQFYQE